MPWHQTDPVIERLKFVAAAQSGHVSMTELCRRFGISRKTGYRLLDRYESDGPAALSRSTGVFSAGGMSAASRAMKSSGAKTTA